MGNMQARSVALKPSEPVNAGSVVDRLGVAHLGQVRLDTRNRVGTHV